MSAHLALVEEPMTVRQGYPVLRSLRVVSDFDAENVVADHAYNELNGRCTCGVSCGDRKDHLVHVVAEGQDRVRQWSDWKHQERFNEDDIAENYEAGRKAGYKAGWADGRNP